MLRIIRVLAFILLALLAAAIARAASGVQVVSRPEIALREAPDGLTIFVVDPGRGALLAGRVDPGAKLSVADLQPFAPPGMLRRPVTVAVRGSRLVVVDGAIPAVFECDLAQQKWRDVWKGQPLRVPASVAIAADGSVVVADLELRGLLVISPSGEPRVTKAGELPRRVRSDDRGVLYVLDGELGVVRIDSLDPARGFTSQPEQIRGVVTVPVSPDASDFSVVRDVFYTADTGGVRVSVPGSRVSLPLPAFYGLRASDLAASDNFLAVLDEDRMAIAVGERALPAETVLDHLEGNPNAAWLDLLQYLVGHTLVASRPVRLQENETTYEQVLARTGVLAPWDNAAKLAPPQAKVSALFCALNRTACASGAPDFPRSPRAEVVVPQVTLRATLDTESVVLNGRSVQQLVDERVLTREQRASVNDAYLASINPDAGSTLEAEMARLGFVAATPMARNLNAGALIQIDGGTEHVIGSLRESCGLDAPARTRTALAERLDAPAAALPAASRARAADRVDIVVSGWQREVLPTSALVRCRPKGDTEGVYVIAEAISAMDVRVVAPPGGHRAQEMAPETISGPIYLGYKPVPLSGLAMGVALPVSDLRSLKRFPRTAGTFSMRTEGSVTLPVTRWRADLLVPVRDYYSSTSPLAELRRQYVGLELSARERLRVSAMSRAEVLTGGQWPPDTKQFLNDCREKLREAISYISELAQTSGTEGVYIGIVEDSRSVNLDHPDFADVDRSAWYEYASDVGLHQHVPAASATPSSAPVLRKLVPSLEHGTHVAGIIAARSNALTPGLLPATNLVLVPSDDMARLVRSIEDARSERVFIFNMSLSFPASEANAIAALRRRLVNSWQDSLFVVAAGNGNDDLNASGAGEPARWAGELPNVIAVAATKSDGSDVLLDHVDPDGPGNSVGSNFGSKVVDLLAPGQMICSLGRTGYAYACGSSQAAPQVTAAAAMLWTLVRTPARLRARLIYTADWKSQYINKAWGGLLNVRRAVSYPLQNILTTFSESEPHEVVLDGNARVEIDGTEYKRDGSQPAFHAQVPFSNILRLTRADNGQYRIFLLKSGTEMAIVDGDVQGRLRCRSMTHFDSTAQRFGAAPHPMSDCRPGIDVGQIKDYVAGTPTDVRFF